MGFIHLTLKVIYCSYALMGIGIIPSYDFYQRKGSHRKNWRQPVAHFYTIQALDGQCASGDPGQQKVQP